MEYTSLYESSVLKKEKKKKKKKKVYTLPETKERGKKNKNKKWLYLPKIIVTVISFEDTTSGPDV
jgi:hypothetical protein